MYKIIVAHPHQQHSYQLAKGLKTKGVLFKYITTVYNQKKSLTSLVLPFLPGELKKRAAARRDSEIDGNVIQYCEMYGLLYLFLMRIVHNNKRIMDPYNRFVSKRFGKKVAKYAIRNNVDAVICFDTECKELFEYIKKKKANIVCIMDASAVNRLYLRKVYKKDMELFPEFANRLKNERPELFSKQSLTTMRRLKREIELTDYFLTPSRIVNKSFLYSGVSKEKFLLCPYGVDLGEFGARTDVDNQKKTIEVIYVGGIKELKGIGHLLKAFKQIPPGVAKLTVVGAGNTNDSDVKDYMTNVGFTGHVIHDDIPALLKKSDVFVFPSLGDSFGLAVLEGMACGLPVIVSKNAGISDYIREGEEGFVISTFSEKEIVQKIIWYYEHPVQRGEMGKKAAERAKEFTWENYYDKVGNSVLSVLNHKL